MKSFFLSVEKHNETQQNKTKLFEIVYEWYTGWLMWWHLCDFFFFGLRCVNIVEINIIRTWPLCDLHTFKHVII